MAASCESAIHTGCDFVYDFCCTTCDENTNVNKEAQYYCEHCYKYYCEDCVKHHNQLLKKHSVLGRKYVAKWNYSHEDAFEQCEKHNDRKLEVFCEDHSELLCTICHIRDHQKCSKVVLIADKTEAFNHEGDFLQMTDNYISLQRKINQKRQEKEKNIESLMESYNKTLDSINLFNDKVCDIINQLKMNSINKLDTLTATLKTSLLCEIGKCSSLDNSMQKFSDKLQSARSNVDSRSFILYKKCLDLHSKIDLELKNIGDRTDVALLFNLNDTIERALSSVSDLGSVVTTNRNKLIAITSKTQYSLKQECWVSCISEKEDENFLITDKKNRQLKLLDQTFKVAASFELPGEPLSMCSISGSQVAVAVNAYPSKYEIHFITVTNDQMVNDRQMKLEHRCTYIVNHQGNLLITSGTGLYQYAVDGRLVSKMYEDTSWGNTVVSCAVSPHGDRIYVANVSRNSLTTLSMNGTVLATISNPAFKWEDIILQDRAMARGYNITVTAAVSATPGLYVTHSGQVLVCGGGSHTILQVDMDGRHVLAEVATGISHPTSVFCSKRKGLLVVGMWNNDTILVFKTQ